MTPDRETELQGLIQQLKNGIKECSENSVRNLQGSVAISKILEAGRELKNLSVRDEVDSYCCSSCCRFELYGVDFGWGMPRWLALAVAYPQIIVY